MKKPLDSVEYLLSEADPALLTPCGGEIAFAGRSNVGKSSLLNALCRKTLARVSGKPGRTRTINVFLAGYDRWLVDLPGYGFACGPQAERARWKAMIEGYLVGRPSMRRVDVLIDAKIGPTDLDRMMLEWLEDKGLPWSVAATKTDQVQSSRALIRRRETADAMGLQPEEIAWTSAEKGIGINILRAEVNALLGPQAS